LAAPRSSIYEALVKAEDDIIGLIAYALYKQSKREFLAGHAAKNNAEADEAAISAFCLQAQLPRSIQQYRINAAESMSKLTDEVFKGAIDDVKREYQEQLAEVVKGFEKPTFWHSVWEHAVSSFMVLLMVGLIFLLIYLAKTGFTGTIEVLTGWSPPKK
jgi:hypothetical protein